MPSVNRLVVTLTLVLLAAFGGQTRAVAKALTDPNIASGGFAENCGTRARFHPPQPLDFAEETNHRGYETASGRSKWPSRDPIGEEGGICLYAFVAGDPVNRSDYLDGYGDARNSINYLQDLELDTLQRVAAQRHLIRGRSYSAIRKELAQKMRRFGLDLDFMGDAGSESVDSDPPAREIQETQEEAR